MLSLIAIDGEFVILLTAIFVVTYLLVALIINHAVKKNDSYHSQDYLVGWFGFAGAAIIVIVFFLSLISHDRTNNIRRADCRERVLTQIVDVDSMSPVDIEYVISKTCK